VVDRKRGDVFFLRALALRAPQNLWPLDTGSGFGLYDVGAMIALGVFTVDWIGFAGSTIRAGVLFRLVPILLIAGFFAAPLAGALLHAWGAVLGNAILGAGWCWLGYEVRRRPADLESSATPPSDVRDRVARPA
jgi:hypothetical protein